MNERKLCPKCQAEMIRAESGVSIGSLGSNPIRYLWRWYCPECHHFPSGGSAVDGERIVAVTVQTLETFVEYAESGNPFTYHVDGHSQEYKDGESLQDKLNSWTQIEARFGDAEGKRIKVGERTGTYLQVDTSIRMQGWVRFDDEDKQTHVNLADVEILDNEERQP